MRTRCGGSPEPGRQLREGSRAGPGRTPIRARSRPCPSIRQPDEEQRPLSALCLLSRPLLQRCGPFVDTVVRKSANVHLSGGPPGTPSSCDSSPEYKHGASVPDKNSHLFPRRGRERGVVEDSAADNAACLHRASPRRINDIPGDSSSLSFN